MTGQRRKGGMSKGMKETKNGMKERGKKETKLGRM